MRKRLVGIMCGLALIVTVPFVHAVAPERLPANAVTLALTKPPTKLPNFSAAVDRWPQESVWKLCPPGHIIAAYNVGRQRVDIRVDRPAPSRVYLACVDDYTGVLNVAKVSRVMCQDREANVWEYVWKNRPSKRSWSKEYVCSVGKPPLAEW